MGDKRNKKEPKEPMQMGRIHETKLVRRAGGKNVKTQLSEDEPTLVQEIEEVKGKTLQKPVIAYVNVAAKGAFYQGLLEVVKADKDVPKGQLLKVEILSDTARVFADPKYKPQLLKCEIGRLDATRVAQVVALKSYRTKLETLRYEYAKNGQVKQQEAVASVLAALDKMKTLPPSELEKVFDTIGKDLTVTKNHMKPLLDDMVDQGLLAKDDVIEFESKYKEKGQPNMKAENVTRFMSAKVGLFPDYTVGSKNLEDDEAGYVKYDPKKTRITTEVKKDNVKDEDKPINLHPGGNEDSEKKEGEYLTNAPIQKERRRSPDKKGSESPIQKGKQSPSSKGQQSPVQKGKQSPSSRKEEQSPIQEGKQSPSSKGRQSPIQKGKQSPSSNEQRRSIEKDKQRPSTKGQQSPIQKVDGGKDESRPQEGTALTRATGPSTARPTFMQATNAPAAGGGYGTIRPTFMQATKLAKSDDPVRQGTNVRGGKTKSKFDQTVTVNLDDRTNRTKTNFNFKEARAKIARIEDDDESDTETSDKTK